MNTTHRRSPLLPGPRRMHGDATVTTTPRTRVLVAVAGRDVALDEAVVAHAARLAADVDGDLHVAAAYATVDSDARRCQVARYLPALNVKARDRRRGAIGALLRRLRIEPTGIHVEPGRLDAVIDALSSKLHARVVVVASTGGGLPEVLIRSTDARHGDVSMKRVALSA